MSKRENLVIEVCKTRSFGASISDSSDVKLYYLLHSYFDYIYGGGGRIGKTCLRNTWGILPYSVNIQYACKILLDTTKSSKTTVPAKISSKTVLAETIVSETFVSETFVGETVVCLARCCRCVRYGRRCYCPSVVQQMCRPCIPAVYSQIIGPTLNRSQTIRLHARISCTIAALDSRNLSPQLLHYHLALPVKTFLSSITTNNLRWFIKTDNNHETLKQK